MNFIQKIIYKHKEKIRIREEQCNKLIEQLEMSLDSLNDIFNDKNSYIEKYVSAQWIQKNTSIISDTNKIHLLKYKKSRRYKNLLKLSDALHTNSNALNQLIARHNIEITNKRIPLAYDLIGNIENQILDKQQMASIVKDFHNQLVIAGAGTGKTTTVIGKIKYLLATGKYKPEEFLVLSFTNASASEMSARIEKETNCKIEASTFHKLGLNILTSVNGVKPKITSINLHAFIKEKLEQNMKSRNYLNLLSTYLLFNRIPAKSEFEFTSKSEYDEYLRLNPPTTFNNEIVKSYGEMDIANFLHQNGINYIYEHPYEIETRTDLHSQYYPDFYLPDYNIYIEYFGINRNGEVPSYFKGDNGMSASEIYNSSMNWKRELHKENNTVMIECFSYEKFEGTLLTNLEKCLMEHSVELHPKTPEELWTTLTNEDNSILDGVIELFGTVINLIKSNNYTLDTVKNINSKSFDKINNSIILELIEPIYCAYEKHLSANQEIDFNDMINYATEYVRQGKYMNPYKFVIVDEYQDIAKARYCLLKALRDSMNYDLFCVGDDWQSIYRFTGSDIGFILNFEDYWGPTEVSKIETTYRFSPSLINISGNFIMKNPAQIKKSIQGKNNDQTFALGEIRGYTEKYAIQFMTKKLEDLPQGSSVYFLGRYSFDVELVKESGLFYVQYNKQTGLVNIIYPKRKDLNIQFLTAHKSKGLQADYVFILNNKKSRMGFPSKVQDAPILKLLLDNCDNYPFAEERRLFYVALTRAKKKVFLLTVEGKESEFAMELKYAYRSELTKEQFTCPDCGGRLIRKTSKYGDFFGCSNYRNLGCTYTRKIGR